MVVVLVEQIFYRFVGDGSGIFLSVKLSRNQSFMPNSFDFNSAKGIDVGYSHLPRGMANVDGKFGADYYRFVGDGRRPRLSVMLSKSNGFGPQHEYISSPGIDVGYSHLPRGMADVDGNGQADFYRFVGDGSKPRLSVMLAKGNGFGPQHEYISAPGIDVGYSHLPRGMADVDGNGHADFYRFVGDSRRPFLSVMLAYENGFGPQHGFVSSPGIDLGYSHLPRGMADFDDDDQADFYRFVGDKNKPFLSVMLAKDTSFGYQYELNSAAGIDHGYTNMLSGMADITGDGRADFYRLVGPPRSWLSVLVTEENGFSSDQYRWNLRAQ